MAQYFYTLRLDKKSLFSQYFPLQEGTMRSWSVLVPLSFYSMGICLKLFFLPFFIFR